LASAASVPVPETARYAVRTAMATGAVCRAPIRVVRAVRTIRESGAATRDVLRGRRRTSL